MSEEIYTPRDITNPLRTGAANPCCDSGCGSKTCASGIPTKCYSSFVSSQSFFLQMKKQNRAARACSNYAPGCDRGGCASKGSRTCSVKNGKQRITTYTKTGMNASPHQGGGSAKEILKQTKHRSAKTVRGKQVSQATLIRAARPVQRLPISTLGRPHTYGTGVMLARTPHRPAGWNKPQSKECCTDTEARPQPPSSTPNLVRGVPQNVIGPGNPCNGPCTCGFCGTCGENNQMD
jgi:hypothetical protein